MSSCGPCAALPGSAGRGVWGVEGGGGWGGRGRCQGPLLRAAQPEPLRCAALPNPPPMVALTQRTHPPPLVWSHNQPRPVCWYHCHVAFPTCDARAAVSGCYCRRCCCCCWKQHSETRGMGPQPHTGPAPELLRAQRNTHAHIQTDAAQHVPGCRRCLLGMLRAVHAATPAW
jgi:hypothetical protein